MYFSPLPLSQPHAPCLRLQSAPPLSRFDRHRKQPGRERNNSAVRIMSFVQELLKPGGGIALIPYIRATIIVLMLMVM